jgi:threonyl-tRNA synthetase
MAKMEWWWMQRVYGVTFPDKNLMKDYKHRMEEAKKRDHRRLGTQQDLFFFDTMSPGSCFFLPHGARIYNSLIQVRWAAAPSPGHATSSVHLPWSTRLVPLAGVALYIPAPFILSFLFVATALATVEATVTAFPTCPSTSSVLSLAVQYIRELYWRFEYEEVVTPNIYNFDLWKRSGHADHYKQNMFLIDIEKQEFGLKPMNCPGADPLAVSMLVSAS